MQLRVLIINLAATDNSDDEFDINGMWTIDRLMLEHNGQDYRFWGSVTAGILTAKGWSSAAIWVGKGAQARVDHLIASNDNVAPLLIVAGSTDVEIARCTLDSPTGAVLVKSEGSKNHVVLGAGCR